MATPNGNLALLRTFVRFPVVVHMIAVLLSKKSCGVVPHSMMPGGWTFHLWLRSTQYCRASTTFGSSNEVCVPAAFIRRTSFSVVRPWNSQKGKPDEGISTPHWVTLPAASRLVSFWPNVASSSQVLGGWSGLSPASLNASLFQNMTTVERWNGTPQVLPPVRLFSMNAG